MVSYFGIPNTGQEKLSHSDWNRLPFRRKRDLFRQVQLAARQKSTETWTIECHYEETGFRE